MIRPVWKRALAVQAALSLALGGALFASAPAIAAPIDPPVTTQPLVITAPADGEVGNSRFVIVFGTATPGSTVRASIGQTVYGSGTAPEDGEFAFNAGFPYELGESVTFVVSATAPDGTEAEPVTRQVILPAPLATPVITSPTAGQRVAADRFTVAGTGVPGENIFLAVVPAGVLDGSADIFEVAAGETGATLGSGTNRIVVAADGRWSTPVSLAPGAYTTAAVLIDQTGEFLSLASAPVDFSIAAGAAAAPGGDQLAATGADDNALAAIAGLMLLSGAALVVLRRKRGLVG